MTSLDDQTQVGRERTAVTSAGSLLVRVRSGHIVGELARALEHFALVVRTILVLNLLRHGLDLVDGVRDTDKIAPGNAVERVAGSANLAVHLVSSPNAGMAC